VSANLALAAIVALAAWAGFLYLAPFGRCPKCRGTGTVKRNSGKRVKVKVCPGARASAASRGAAPAPYTGCPPGPPGAGSRRQTPAAGGGPAMRGTWQTTDSGGRGEIVLAVLAVLAGAAIAGPMLAAVAELVHIVLIVAAVLLALGAAALVAYVAWRLRQSRAGRVTPVSFPRPLPQRPGESITAPQRPVIERPAELHLHFHRLSAEEAAAAIRQAHGGQPGP
jgi:hypothetical protein